MKKLITLLAATVFVFTACEKDNNNNNDGNGGGQGGNPVAGLVVKNEKKVLVVENTGAWCQYCPNGAEIMLGLQEAYNYVLPVAVHNNDGLANSVAQQWELLFPDGGFPTIHVNEEALENYGNAEQAVTLAHSTGEAMIGVAHRISDVDTGYTVDIKVEVFEDMSGKNFFVQSFLMLGDVLANDYSNMGGDDLRQVSSVPLVDKGPVGGNSYWAQDAAFVDTVPMARAGEAFYHKDNIWAVAAGDSNMTSYGLPLAVVNPFGTDYVAGDIFGTQFTPIQLTLDYPSGTGVLNYQKLQVLTIMWEFVIDGGDPKYLFTNGYMSEMPAN